MGLSYSQRVYQQLSKELKIPAEVLEKKSLHEIEGMLNLKPDFEKEGKAVYPPLAEEYRALKIVIDLNMENYYRSR